MPTGILKSLGGEAGCQQLSNEFYARVARDPILRPLFPGKSLRCATEEFAAFLIQFLGGDEAQTQSRWWLSVRESHARFQIGNAQRAAWLNHMTASLDAASLDEPARTALRQFFSHTSAYVTGEPAAPLEPRELHTRWAHQRVLDELIASIAAGNDDEALAPSFVGRPSVCVGVLARMIQSGRPALIRFACDAIERDASLATRRSAGKTILHYASAAGCAETVELLLRQGADPNIRDRGEHPPLYCLANE